MATKEIKETLTSQQRHVGGYMIRIMALLTGRHAITVVDVIISQLYIVAESVEVHTRLKALRRLIKRSVLTTIQMKYMWSVSDTAVVTLDDCEQPNNS